jgi:class 3 adenylate cyclase
MEATEKRLVVILADISGYTKFMVENEMSAVHGQQYITLLIETLLREVDIPLRLQEIEGDALFLYAEDPGSDDEWEEVLTQVHLKLMRFFDAFYEGVVLANDASPCKCAVCKNAGDLALKIVVHSGTAVFHTIGKFDMVSGSDVILAHRLLKNSVPDDEYLLMTDTAYAKLGKKMDGEFLPGSESYDDFGTVNTFVRFMGEVKEQHRDSLYEMPPATLALRAERYVADTMLGMFPAMVKQLRLSAPKVGWMRRIGFAFKFILTAPMMAMLYIVEAPRRLLSNRTSRENAKIRQTDSV